MKPTASEKAVERGKQDCRNGITRNPFLHIGGKHKHLASWWDKGFAEEQSRIRGNADVQENRPQ